MQRIDFFYFDKQTCQRCQETGRNLHDALSELGISTKVVEHKLEDHEQDVEGFGKVISPSIFFDGKDIFSKTSTSLCGECSEICGKPVSCRAESDESDQLTKKAIKKAVSELSHSKNL